MVIAVKGACKVCLLIGRCNGDILRQLIAAGGVHAGEFRRCADLRHGRRLHHDIGALHGRLRTSFLLRVVRIFRILRNLRRFRGFRCLRSLLFLRLLRDGRVLGERLLHGCARRRVHHLRQDGGGQYAGEHQHHQQPRYHTFLHCLSLLYVNFLFTSV